MRIDQLLQQGEPCFSFEFFPPKTDAGTDALLETVRELRALEPSFVSVTYGAGGTTQDRTLGLVGRIKRELGVETMSHLTCAGQTSADLRRTLYALAKDGIENVICLRGDPPKGETTFKPVEGGLAHAVDLVRVAQDFPVFCLGVAGYPEGHIESPDRYSDLLRLKEKVDAGASFVVTQLFFDNECYFDFVSQARRMGITVPIIPGVMPITNVEQVDRFTKMCGVAVPHRLRLALEARKTDPQAVLEFGVAYATLQCAELLKRGAAGIHFYTLNRSSATRAILAALRAMRPWR